MDERARLGGGGGIGANLRFRDDVWESDSSDEESVSVAQPEEDTTS